MQKNWVSISCNIVSWSQNVTFALTGSADGEDGGGQSDGSEDEGRGPGPCLRCCTSGQQVSLHTCELPFWFHVKIYIRWMNLSPCLSGFWRASCVASTVRRRKRWRLWGGSLVKPSLVLPLLHSTRYQLWRQTPPAPASSQKLPFYVFPHLSPLKPCLLFFPKVSLVDSSWEM